MLLENPRESLGTMGRKDKLVVTFDAAARREYLVGFRKRKKERQAKALEDLSEKRAKIVSRAERK